jgi:hypothetical protein
MDKFIPRDFSLDEWSDFQKNILTYERFSYTIEPMILYNTIGLQNNELLGWKITKRT